MSAKRGVTVSVAHEEPLRRVRMSWEEFRALPERPRAEWVDGEAVITVAPVGFAHGDAVARLAAVLVALLPHHFVVTEVGVWLPRNRLRAPDLMVVSGRPDGDFVREAPLLVVEVLSPSTRSEDTIRKSAEYAEAGVEQYWIVDPELHAVDLLRNVGGEWEFVAKLDDERPSAAVELAGVTLSLELHHVLRG